MKKELEIMEKVETTNLLKESCSMIETKHAIMATNEKGDDNKLKYSNETSRQAEIKRRLLIDVEYQDKEKDLKQRDREINIKKIELNFLINKQGNLRAITRLYNE